MGKFTILLLFFITVYGLLNAQEQEVTVSGYVKNGENGEGISEAIVHIKELNRSILVEKNASYTITLKSGRYTFIVSCLGYTTQEFKLNLRRDAFVVQDFLLKEDNNVLEAAVVSGHKNDNVKRPQMGVERLNIEQIKAIPALMGEVDVIKSLQLLPGVQAAAEGSSGFNVRGGTPD